MPQVPFNIFESLLRPTQMPKVALSVSKAGKGKASLLTGWERCYWTSEDGDMLEKVDHNVTFNFKMCFFSVISTGYFI